MVYFRSVNDSNAPEDPPRASDGDPDVALPRLDPVSSTIAIPVSSLSSSGCPFPSSSLLSSSSLSSTYTFLPSSSLSSPGYPFPVVLSSSSLSPSAYPFPLSQSPSASLPSPPSLSSCSSSSSVYPYSFPLLPSPPLSSAACPFPAFADSVSVAVAMQVPVFAPPPLSLPLRSVSSSVQMSVDTARLLREMHPANDSTLPTSQESGNHNSSSSDNNIQPWLQTLRLQSVGACREDERLPPLLGWNSASTSSSFNNEPDGHLLDHLSRHFKARELGLLVRCLCAPLVSIRVGRVDQEGCVLHPTSSRFSAHCSLTSFNKCSERGMGYLHLNILQCSRLHLSFVGDDGHSERIALTLSGSEHPPVTLEVLSPDATGRSFVIKLPGGRQVFFWQSEKIKDYGNELLIKMKDLLLRRPTLAQLTGVNESRFNSFMNDVPTSPLISPMVSSDANTAPSSSVSFPQPQSSNQAATVREASSQMVSLGKAQFGSEGSSNLSGFKDGRTMKGAIGVRSIIMPREKQRRHISDISTKPTIPPYISAGCKINAPQGAVDLITVSGNNTEQHSVVSHSIGLYASLRPSCTAGNGLAWNHDTINLPVISTCSAPHTILSTLGTGFLSNLTSLQPSTLAHLSVTGSTILAPRYCPCPLRSSSSLQYTVTPPYLPSAYVASSMPNSSSSSLFSVRSTPTIISPNSISLDRVSLSPISLPVSSLVNLTSPLQSSSFTSFFSDPIVHTPVIGVQSGAQSFLVNTPPIPKFMNDILPNTGGHSEGADMPALSFLRQKGLSVPWENKPEGVQSNADKPLSFLTDLPCLDLMKSGFGSRAAAAGFAKQDHERSWDQKESCLSSFGESLTVPFNILYETMPIASNCSDTVHYDTSSQHEEPYLGMLPTKLNGGSLSCLLSFNEDKGKNPNIWISGSRGLYGGSCDPGMPVPAYHSSIMSLESKSTCEEKSSKGSDTRVESSLINPVDDENESEQNANS